jgi:hypothetical protein
MRADDDKVSLRLRGMVHDDGLRITRKHDRRRLDVVLPEQLRPALHQPLRVLGRPLHQLGDVHNVRGLDGAEYLNVVPGDQGREATWLTATSLAAEESIARTIFIFKYPSVRR